MSTFEFGGGISPQLLRALLPLILAERQRMRPQGVPTGAGPDQVPVLFGQRPVPQGRPGVQSDDGLDPYTIPAAPPGPQTGFAPRAPNLGGGYQGPGGYGPEQAQRLYDEATRVGQIPVAGQNYGRGVYRNPQGAYTYKGRLPAGSRRGGPRKSGLPRLRGR